jgi:hypothetical protein
MLAEEVRLRGSTKGTRVNRDATAKLAISSSGPTRNESKV